MPGHVLDACVVEDLQAAGLLAANCTNLERPVVGGFAASADTELASRMAELVRYGVRVRHLTSLELPQHESMLAHYRALSVADAEALVIARADSAVLLTSPGVRPYVRSIIERFRGQTVVMSQNEIHPRARLRTVGMV